jgi:hypothetical protein
LFLIITYEILSVVKSWHNFRTTLTCLSADRSVN